MAVLHRINARQVVAATLSLWVWMACCCGAARADAIDDYVRAQMKAQHMAGLSLALVKNGAVVRSAGYGKANIELDVPASPATVYQMGSVGKQFTAAGVLLLVQDGKLGLDDSIHKYLSDAPEAWGGVTVRHLLTHTSGISDYANPAAPFDFRRDTTYPALLRALYALPSDFAPGEKWAYCNTNYVLLGYVIEKASGKFYGDFLQARIFKPLGMTHTRIINERDLVPNRAAGYETKDGAWKNQGYIAPIYNTLADGALYTTVLDLAKWDAALYGNALLSAPSKTAMWTPAKLKGGATFPYGFGWSLEKTANGRRLVEHDGAWQGFTAHIARYTDDKTTVIVLCNTAGTNPAKIAHRVAALYSPMLALSVAPPPAPLADTEPQVTEQLREFLRRARTGTATEQDVTPEFWPTVRAQRQAIQTLLTNAGVLLKLEPLRRTEPTATTPRQYQYRATFEKSGALLISFGLTKDAPPKFAWMGLKGAE